MSKSQKFVLTPMQEGLVGASIGLIIGIILLLVGVLSHPGAATGVALGMGIASWINAKRRADKPTDEE